MKSEWMQDSSSESGVPATEHPAQDGVQGSGFCLSNAFQSWGKGSAFYGGTFGDDIDMCQARFPSPGFCGNSHFRKLPEEPAKRTEGSSCLASFAHSEYSKRPAIRITTMAKNSRKPQYQERDKMVLRAAWFWG